MLSLVFALPVLATTTDETSCHLKTTPTPWLLVYLPIVCFLLPLTVISLVYTIILYTMVKKIREKKQSSKVLSLALNAVSPPLRIAENSKRRLSRSYDEGLELVGQALLSRQKSHHVGKSLQANINSARAFIEPTKPISLQSLRGNLLKMNRWSECSWKSEEADDLDPLQQLRHQAHKKIKAKVAKERHLARVMFLLIGVFTLCWLPFWSLYICLAFFASCYPPPYFALACAQWLALSNSLVNPIIYTVFNKEFKDAIRETLSSCLPVSSRSSPCSNCLLNRMDSNNFCWW